MKRRICVSPCKEAYHVAAMRWHPDKFTQRFGGVISPSASSSDCSSVVYLPVYLVAVFVDIGVDFDFDIDLRFFFFFSP